MKKDVSHFRRCHVCGETSENTNHVDRCANCGKVFAPYYYIDELKAPSFSEDTERPLLIEGEFAPLIGVSTIWWYQEST